MTKSHDNKLNEESEAVFYYSSDEMLIQEYRIKCQTLKTQIKKLIRIRENLFVLDKQNENISKSLVRLRTDYDLYKSHLGKTLYMQKIAIEKQKILLKKKVDDFTDSRKRTEEYYKVSPRQYELNKIKRENISLEKECKAKSDLLEQTKKQFNELESFLVETFNKKVCEFCHSVISLKVSN